MSKEAQKTQQQLARENYEQTIELKNTMEAGYFLMGKLLTDCKRNGWYKLNGHDTFEEYLGTPEISFHRTTAYKYMKVYSEFIEYYKLDQKDLQGIDIDKLYLILPIVDKKTVKEWLEKARTLSRSDLRYSIQGKKQKQMIEAGSEWLEYADVWEKTQPVSRWGKNPKQSIYGQFVANLINYYTADEELVTARVGDTVVKDVAWEFQRKYKDIKEGENITQVPELKGKLGITMTPNLSVALQELPTVVNMFRKMVKKGGKLAFYIKQHELNEDSYSDFITGVQTLTMNEFVPERLIIIRERPDVKRVNQAIKDEKMDYSFERIVIFKRDDTTK